jgi:hypothetical protein
MLGSTSCGAGFSQAQFARSVAHIDYIKYAIENGNSVFSMSLPPLLPDEGDLLCASEGKIDPDRGGFDLGHPESLTGLLLHCYVVVRSTISAIYVVGGNVTTLSIGRACRAKNMGVSRC